MAKLTRKTLLQFGSTVNAGSEIGQFGSYASPVFSADIDILQAGTAWPRGWAAETVASNRPFLEDMNAVDVVFGYMLAYLLQMGIPEYDPATTYYIDSFCQVSGQIYQSLTDNNTGNTPSSSPVNWSPGIGSKNTESAGVIKMFAGAIAPAGYLICDGSAISRSTYANLFSVCGTLYGSGDGSTTFNIPDMRLYTPVGLKAGDPDFSSLGNKFGERNHILNVEETPPHQHLLIVDANTNQGLNSGNSVARTYVVSGDAYTDIRGHSSSPNVGRSSSVGGGGGHNNMQPSIALNFIIKT